WGSAYGSSMRCTKLEAGRSGSCSSWWPGSLLQARHDCSSPRFLPRRPPLRQITSLSSFYLLDHKTRQMELGLDYGLPQAQLSNAKFVFQDGKWQSEGSPTHQLPFRQLFPSSGQEQSNKVLKKENKALLEENNYLKLQLELLMDMLTDTTAQLHTVEKKLDLKFSKLSKRWQ
uniref:Chibby family member 3 n=1 Tax=Crocodylus porosus TaxID=8502 RepID=A0A7M4F0E8_CROPO